MDKKVTSAIWLFASLCGCATEPSFAPLLSGQNASLLRTRLAQIQQHHMQVVELQSNIDERARRYWNLTSNVPAATVTVELQELQLNSRRDDSVRCVVRVLVSVQPNPARPAATPQQKRYQYVGPFGSLAVWLDEGSDFVDTTLTNASRQIASQIIADITAR